MRNFDYDENKYPAVSYDENGNLITYERWVYIVDFISRRKNEYFIYPIDWMYKYEPPKPRKRLCRCAKCTLHYTTDVYAEFKKHYDMAMKK